MGLIKRRSIEVFRQLRPGHALDRTTDRESTGIEDVARMAALAAETDALRQAFLSLLEVVEARQPAARGFVLDDLNVALARASELPSDAALCQARRNALIGLIETLEATMPMR